MFQPYRFSPIRNQNELLQAIDFLNSACYRLVQQILGKHPPVVGNVGVFCHYEEEYKCLVQIREKLTKPSDNPNQKYFQLHQPIIFVAKDGVPEAVYTHLYIRKPDPYRGQVGDVDFSLDPEAYDALKQKLLKGDKIKGARVFDRPDLDMIELYSAEVDALAYIVSR